MAVMASAQCTLSVTVDVSAVVRYYLLQASTATKPAKPTVKAPSGWTTTEPTYTTGSTNSLYTCERTDLTDGSWAWSDVSLSSSYEAAKAAYNAATAAGTAAAAAKTYVCSSSTASATAAKTADASGFSLVTGAQVAVTFANANTAASPTLNVSSTGAKAIMLNGSNSVYWLASALVSMVYDGSCWQVVVPALYGATATIGNPGASNIYIDSDSVDFRDSTTVRETIGYDATRNYSYIKTDNALQLMSGVGKAVCLAMQTSEGYPSDIGIGVTTDSTWGMHVEAVGTLLVDENPIRSRILKSAASTYTNAITWRTLEIGGTTVALGTGTFKSFLVDSSSGQLSWCYFARVAIPVNSGIFSSAPLGGMGSSGGVYAFSTSAKASWTKSKVYFDLWRCNVGNPSGEYFSVILWGV